MKRVIPGLVALALLTLPAGAAGQLGLELRVIPRFGLLVPDGNLYEEYVHFGVDPLEWTRGRLGRAGMVGLAVEARAAVDGLWLQGEVMRSFNGWMFGVHSVLTPSNGFTEPSVDATYFDVPAAITTLSLRLVLPTAFTVLGVQPYVAGGVSGKHYTFGDPSAETPVPELAVMPTEGLNPGGDIGGGFRVTLPRFELDLHVRDTINRYGERMRHDVVVAGGVAWRVF